ncbi:leukotriene C4 synthase [Corythoichthys intestinalis]|uniref:leukotriene C4 synthase n=1 Tax=Corythoichthys intestinalis TaxID=161448 RepID=UPI0025A50486|nr:leukotriene C4 synthase [Corythoichthys intestinalis]XP_061793338.1 leukotriene C4 synthase-like [Nerophis lumbriciformis]
MRRPSVRPSVGCRPSVVGENAMESPALGLAAVTVSAVLQQAYFSLQVIGARRKFRVSPPCTSGPPDFERLFRAQANCSEYFPMFVALLWTSGIFFNQGVSCACGALYLYARLRYFHGYAESAQQRLRPLYVSAALLWLLVAFSCVGILSSFWRLCFHANGRHPA